MLLAQRLTQDGLLDALINAISRGETEYSVSDLGVPGLRHFVYKSRAHVQVTMPLFEDPYDVLNEKRRYATLFMVSSGTAKRCSRVCCRLTTLYQTMYDAIHAKSGQGSTLKLQYIRTERESVMGWVCTRLLDPRNGEGLTQDARLHSRSSFTLPSRRVYPRAQP